MRALAILLVLLAAAPAAAAGLSPHAAAQLDRGRPYVEVRADGEDAATGLILGIVDIDAPPRVVFATIADCALAPRMAASLKSCRILDRDPGGRWDLREHVSRGGLLPSVRSVLRFDYDPPRRIRFAQVEGDLPVLDGTWTLQPQAGGGARVTYEARVGVPFRVPGPIARIMLRHDVAAALVALRREAMAQRP